MNIQSVKVNFQQKKNRIALEKFIISVQKIPSVLKILVPNTGIEISDGVHSISNIITTVDPQCVQSALHNAMDSN